MSWRTASAYVLVLVCAVAVGFWSSQGDRTRPTVPGVYDTTPVTTPPSAGRVTPDVARPPATSAPVATTAPRRSNAASGSATARPASVAPGRTEPRLILSAALVKQVKPLLNPGADILIAAEGFRNATEFVTVAHAARNTGVPFMLLKHRVLTEREPLAQAIWRSAPHLNARLEAARARAEARVDVDATMPPRLA